jgi:hypothetical protein
MLYRRRMLAAPSPLLLFRSKYITLSGASFRTPSRGRPQVVSRRHHRPAIYIHSVADRQCRRHVVRSARRVRMDPITGTGRKVAGGGMAAVGFGFPGAGASSSEPLLRLSIGDDAAVLRISLLKTA